MACAGIHTVADVGGREAFRRTPTPRQLWPPLAYRHCIWPQARGRCRVGFEYGRGYRMHTTKTEDISNAMVGKLVEGDKVTGHVHRAPAYIHPRHTFQYYY